MPWLEPGPYLRDKATTVRLVSRYLVQGAGLSFWVRPPGELPAFAGEGPLALDGLLSFAGGFGDVVDLEVFEEVSA